MNLRDLGRRDPARLAVLGLATLAVLLGLALNFNQLPLLNGHTYRAAFTDASGLQVGEEVRVAGLKVGQVTDIDLAGDKVVVWFRVDGVDLGRRTTAGIEVKTLLGQHYLSLTPAGTGRLEPGSTIPLDRTSTPLNIVPAFQRLTAQTQELDTERVAEAFDSLSAVLEGVAPEVRGTLTGLSRLSRSIAGRDEQIRELLSRARSVSGTLAARDQDVVALLEQSSLVLDTLHERRRVIRSVITGTGELSRQLRGLVRDNQGQIGPALAQLDRVVDVLQRREKDLDETLRLAEIYGREFTNVGGSGRWFDASLKFPRGFAVCSTEPTTGLSALLDPVLRAVGGATGSSQPCLPLGPAATSRLSGTGGAR